MDDYISRQAAIDEIRNDPMGGLNYKRILTDIPAADVAPVVHSRWEYKCGEIKCPECGNRIHRIDLSGCLNFCPNCGAKMDGERKE